VAALTPVRDNIAPLFEAALAGSANNAILRRVLGADRTRRWHTIAAGASAILLSVAVPLSAQRSVTRSVFVSALDTGGAPVLNLAAADFQIAENGVKRDVSRASLGTAPMRIVLMVDSSTPVAPMYTTFRTALQAFADALPESEEVVFISTGGQIRVRTSPDSGRDKLRAEIARFASEGGANAFLDTLLEADRRFLKTVPGQWPAFVIVTTDNGDGRKEPDVVAYNKFMNDFVARGGAAHAVIVAGKQTGSVTDLVANLVDNTGGIRATIVAESSLPARLREIAERLADDHQSMLNRYEVTYAGDPQAVQPMVEVTVSRDDVRLRMSPRRPF
jgi:hypothetical protein